jgi:hypothetical protein
MWVYFVNNFKKYMKFYEKKVKRENEKPREQRLKNLIEKVNRLMVNNKYKLSTLNSGIFGIIKNRKEISRLESRIIDLEEKRIKLENALIVERINLKVGRLERFMKINFSDKARDFLTKSLYFAWQIQNGKVNKETTSLGGVEFLIIKCDTPFFTNHDDDLRGKIIYELVTVFPEISESLNGLKSSSQELTPLSDFNKFINYLLQKINEAEAEVENPFQKVFYKKLS